MDSKLGFATIGLVVNRYKWKAVLLAELLTFSALAFLAFFCHL